MLYAAPSRLQDTEYFSVVRHDRIRADFWSLCADGWSVGLDELRMYRQDGVTAVGAIRAERSEGVDLSSVVETSK